MAESGKPRSEAGSAGANLKTHPLVDKLTQGGTEPRAVVALVGYIGPSKTDGNVRLYTGLDFQTYFEVPRASVLSAEAIDAEDENSPTQVMVPADTTIELVQTTKQTGAASYLAGSIASGYLPAMALAEYTNFHYRPTIYTLCHCTVTNAATRCWCTQLAIICVGIPGGQVGEEAAMAIPPQGAPEALGWTWDYLCRTQHFCVSAARGCPHSLAVPCYTAAAPCLTYVLPQCTAVCKNTLVSPLCKPL
jgi:hypothetical protein